MKQCLWINFSAETQRQRSSSGADLKHEIIWKWSWISWRSGEGKKAVKMKIWWRTRMWRFVEKPEGEGLSETQKYKNCLWPLKKEKKRWKGKLKSSFGFWKRWGQSMVRSDRGGLSWMGKMKIRKWKRATALGYNVR